MALKLISDPEIEPVTLQEAKSHLRITGLEQAEITEITCEADISGSLSGKYFNINEPITEYYVWYDIAGAGSQDPALAGKTGIKVSIIADDTAITVATNTMLAINANADFVATSNAAVVTITNANYGAVADATNGDTGWSISPNVIQEGQGEDANINTWIKTAREWCEGYQNRAFITQTWEMALDAFPGESIIKVPLPPLQSITSIKYYDTSETESIMPASDYIVDTYSQPGRISLGYGKSWPSTILRPINGVIITFQAGYGDAANKVPEKVIQAIKILVGELYEHREITDIKELKEVPFAVHSLLGFKRIWPL